MVRIALKKCSFLRKLHFYGANLVAFGEEGSLGVLGALGVIGL